MIINKIAIPRQPRSKKHYGASSQSIRRAVSSTVINGGTEGGGTIVQPPCPFTIEAVSDTEYPLNAEIV